MLINVTKQAVSKRITKRQEKHPTSFKIAEYITEIWEQILSYYEIKIKHKQELLAK